MKFPAIDKIIERCESDRESLQYVWVDKNITFASDANIMVLHKSSKLFDQMFLESLGNEQIGLHKEIIRAIRSRINYNLIYLKEEQKIILKPKFYKPEHAELHFKLIAPSYVKPPNYKPVLASAKEGKETVKIAIKPGLLEILNKALGNTPYDVLLMKFNTQNKGVYVKNSSSSDFPDAEGVIMPCMNDEVI